MIRFVGYRFVGLLLLSSSFSKTFLGLGQAGKLRVRMAETAEKQAIRMNMPRNPITGERPCVRMARMGAAAALPVITSP